MDNKTLLDDLKDLVKKHAFSEHSIVCNNFLHEIKFTEAGERLMGKMFAEGKPMNCIPDCTVRIRVEYGTVSVSVCRDGVEIGTFRKVSTALNTTYDFHGVPMQLKMGEF